MKPKTLIAASCAACLLVLVTPAVISRLPVGEPAWMLAEAGAEHRLLDRLVGDWSVSTVVHDPGAIEARTQRSEARGELVADGRLAVLTTRTEADVQRLLLGFDRSTGEYVAVLVDADGTQSVESRGRHDAGSDRLVLVEERNEELGQSGRFRSEWRFEGQGLLIHSYLLRPGEPDRLVGESRFWPRGEPDGRDG